MIPDMPSSLNRPLILATQAVAIAILIPGLIAPVLTIRGVLTKEGLAQVAPQLLEKGLSDDTMAVLKTMMNPAIVGLLQATGRDVRTTIIQQLTPAITSSLQKSVDEVEVYQQTRSILGSVRRLYEVGSPVPATLILLFSVIVPFLKSALVAAATFMTGEARRRLQSFVAAIAKWSMADVFVVALFIAYLAAQASQAPPGDPNAAALIKFDAHFGSGFYWFAAYCLFSLASQQYIARGQQTA